MRLVVLICITWIYGAGTVAQDMSQAELRDAYHRSFAYERTQDYDAAVKALSEVYRIYPAGYTVNLRIGWLYYLNGNQANALEHYDAAIQVAPYSLEAKVGKLLPLLAQLRYDEVETLAYQVVTADYYSYYGNLRLAYVLRMQGKYDQAMAVLTKMRTAYPTDTLYLAELGQLWLAKGEEEYAAAAFVDLLILDPENTVAKAFFAGQ